MNRTILVAIATLALVVAGAAGAQKTGVLGRKAAVAPSPAAAPAHSARFRVTVTGFHVENQTWDDALQRDGKDDEVFVATETRMLRTVAGQPVVTLEKQTTSRVLGDTNGFEDRIRAGGASDDGGLRDGDRVPMRGIWTRQGDARADALPLLVFEDVLDPRTTAIVVATIWEWDAERTVLDDVVRHVLAPLDTAGYEFDVAHKAGGGLLGRDLHGLPPGALRRLSETQIGRDVVGEHAVQERSVVGAAGSRPIGMTMGDDGRYRFDPWVLTMNYGVAARLARLDLGRGPGVIGLGYVDGPALRGRYHLYLHVEQLP